MSRPNPLLILVSLAIPWVSIASSTAQAEVTERQQQVAQEVFDRLIAVTDRPAGWEVWPPEMSILDTDDINAYASQDTRGDVDVPIMVIYRGLIELCDTDPEVLAFTVGHELGHLVFFHVERGSARLEKFGNSGARTAVVAAEREDELEADRFGMELALKAGYSYQGIRRNLKLMRTPKMGSYYCAFEGLRVDHPSWDARTSYLQQTAEGQQLWESTVAFRNGVLFLETENYLHAEFCFQRVTEEFPDCYEAWANLGYAKLMQYCDQLREEDLRSFEIGHLVVGGFYRRPDSINPSEAVRSINPDLWYDAVGSFREALRLRDRLGIDDPMIVVNANLAVAHLIHPAGKDVGTAEKYFEQVFAALKDREKAKTIDPIVHAAILINSGAGRGIDDSLAQRIERQLELAARFRSSEPFIKPLEAAMSYTKARALAASTEETDRVSALEMIEGYLETMSSASSWWPLAYRQYTEIAKRLGKTPREATDFRGPSVYDWRPVTAVELSEGVLIGIADNFETLSERLGEPETVIPVIEGTNVERHYFKNGVSVLGSRNVLAIFLSDANGPTLTLNRPGIGGDSEVIRVGMPVADFETLLGTDWDSEFASIDNKDVPYRFYRSTGVAARFQDGLVAELVVVVVPRASGK